MGGTPASAAPGMPPLPAADQNPSWDWQDDPRVRAYMDLMAQNTGGADERVSAMQQLADARRTRAGADAPFNRGMAIAQMGATTAAGQSPNAMSNVASGMQAGIQAFQNARNMDNAGAGNADAAQAAVGMARSLAADGKKNEALSAFMFALNMRNADRTAAAAGRDPYEQAADLGSFYKNVAGDMGAPSDTNQLSYELMLQSLIGGQGVSPEALARERARRAQ